MFGKGGRSLVGSRELHGDNGGQPGLEQVCAHTGHRRGAGADRGFAGIEHGQPHPRRGFQRSAQRSSGCYHSFVVFPE